MYITKKLTKYIQPIAYNLILHELILSLHTVATLDIGI